LEARSKRSQAEIEEQLKHFLPERFRSLAELREKYGSGEKEEPED